MKKIFLSLVIAMISVASFGQSWETTIQKGDELKGTKGGVVEYYADLTNNCIFFYSENERHWVFVTVANVVYDTHYSSLLKTKTLHLYIGMYDENDNLVDKLNADYMITSKGAIMIPSKKIMKYIKNNKGYVRILIPIFRENDIEFKVPCQI